MLQGERIGLGKVLTFRRQEVAKPRPETPDGERGAILFFTGVRYDRPVQTVTPAGPERSGGSLAS